MKLKKAAVCLVATGLLLAGCGGGDSDSKGANGDSGSKSSSAEAGTEVTQANFASVLGKAQEEAKTGHMEMTTKAEGQAIKAEGDFEAGADAKSTKISMKMSAAGQDFTMRQVDSTLYMNMGEMTGGKFMSIDLTDKSNPLVKQFGASLDQANPTQALEVYSEGLKSFEKKGNAEKLDGVNAQPYELVLDTKKYFEATGADTAALGSSLPKEMTVVMFIGEDNLVRRTTTSVMGSDVQVDFSKWGEGVKIEKPADDEIGDSKKFEQQMGGAAAS